MELWHFWVMLGILLIILEIFTPAFVLGSFGLASLATAIVAALGYNLKFQFAAFSIFTLVVFFTIRPVLKKYFYRFDDQLKTNVSALVGRAGKVLETIQNSENRGRVKIGGEDWKALSIDGEEIHEGEMVIIRKIDGATAYVEKHS